MRLASDDSRIESDSQQDEDFDTDDSEWETEEEEDAACMASIHASLAKKARRSRTKQVVHTPQSWHNLMHAGRVLSEATAKSSTALFEINGKVKRGHELSSSDLAALEGARLSCKVCKETKTTAPAARRAGNAHVSFGKSVTYRPE